jgi:hypothetical protein
VLDVAAEKIQPLGRETIADQRAKIIVLAQVRSAAMGAFQRALRMGINETTVDPLELSLYWQLRSELEMKSAAAR